MIFEFRRRFPDQSPGIINCSDIYTKDDKIKEFKESGNLGAGYHIYLDLINNRMIVGQFVPLLFLLERFFKMRITIKDESLIETLKEYAEIQGASTFQYTEDLLRKSISGLLAYKLVFLYHDGTQTEETHFYSPKDLAESVRAADFLLENPTKLFDGRRIIGWQVWQNGNLIEEKNKGERENE
ncbi:hypothetical protein [Massiliimalia timonensis]|nr:hypothetical protein [Massiliimalia timonensis]